MKQAERTMRLLKLLCLTGLVWSAAGLNAQVSTPTARSISLEECVEMALKNNFDLRIERHNVEQARYGVRMFETVYDPLLSFSARREQSSGLNQSFSDGVGGPPGVRNVTRSRNYLDTLGYSVSGLGPMGSQYAVPVQYTRGTGDGYTYRSWDAFAFNWDTVAYAEYQARASIDLQQPLLRDFAIDNSRRNIQMSRKTLKMSEFIYRARIIDVVTLVRLSYYELIFARENVKVQEQALKLAEKLLDNNRKTFNAGRMAILEVLRAESLVASTKADLLIARQQVSIQENVLKSLVTKDLPEWKNVSVQPAEQLVAVPEVFEVQESWRTGLIKRPDLAQLRVGLERRDIDVRYNKNQTLPDLRLVGSYGRKALGMGAEDVFSDLHFRDKAVDYFYGVELSFPWGNREAKLRLAQVKDQRQQAELTLQKMQQDIMVQIDDSINSAKASFDRIGATRQATEFALRVLQAEESKEGVGLSTPFMIMQYQKDLTTARSQEVRALADYNRALANLAKAEGTTLERLKINLEIK
jgi:outer membrane protein TolC